MAYTGSTPLTPFQNLFNTIETNAAAAAAAVQANLTTAINQRQQYSYRWANAAARTAQAGMRAGDKGYQIDTDTTYRYSASNVWVIWEKSWAAWTPTVTGFTIGTGGSAGIVARYAVTAGVVSYQIAATLGTTGQSVGDIKFTAPVAMTSTGFIADYTGVGSALMHTNSTNAYAGPVVANSTTLFQVRYQNAPGSGNIIALATTSTTPNTWAAGANFTATGTYEPA